VYTRCSAVEKESRMETISEAVCKMANESRPTVTEDIHDTFAKYVALHELRSCPDSRAIALCIHVNNSDSSE